MSIGSPTSSTYGSRRDRDDDKDTGLSDFFQMFGQGLMQSALEQIRALDTQATPDSAGGEGVQDFAENYLRQSTLEMMRSVTARGNTGWPGNLLGSNDNIFSGLGLGDLSGFADFPGLSDFSGLASFPGLGAFPQLGAYQNAGLASQLGGSSYLIEDALKTIAKGLGKSLDEVRATHLSGFTAAL
ncbi:hypothetical protein [Terrihabitans soli]|uniref:hypothetical protein n=1 Tax=Terrihabitans soli TaxID=708113 RepID=UPI001CA36A0B|nr:hypothetical protein [Terrihabitans soli]